MLNIWHKYLFKQLVFSFLFILSALFITYITIDCAEKSAKIFSYLYYGNQFLVYFDFFSPLAFLLASLKVLISLNVHQELVALQMAGISKKEILKPLVFLATLLTLFSYFNGECLLANAKKWVDEFKTPKKKGERLHVISLADETELIYQLYDPVKQELFDCLWIRSKKEIWRFATLSIQDKKASEAELLTRYENQWKRKEKHSEKMMEEMPFEKRVLNRFVPVPNRPLHTLFFQLWTHLPERPMVHAHFFYKLMRPLLPFFILQTVAPLALRFGRARSYLLIVGGSLAAFFGFMTLLDGMLLIGETGLMPGSIAILSPFSLLFLIIISHKYLVDYQKTYFCHAMRGGPHP